MNIKSFFKLYTMPVLALFCGFGLYYVIFVGTSHQDRFSPAQTLNAFSQSDSKDDLSKEDNQPSIASLQESSQGIQTPPMQQEQPQESSKSISPVKEDIPVANEDVAQTYVVVPKTINVRQSPNTLSNIVGKLSQNQKVAVAFVTEGWAKIKDGWVLFELLKKPDTKEISQTSVKPSKIVDTYVVIPKSVNIRSKPDVSSKIVGKLMMGNVVRVISIAEGWAKIKDGWVLLDLLKKQDTH